MNNKGSVANCFTSMHQEEAKKQEEKDREEAAKLRSYSNLMTEDNMKYKLLCQFLAQLF